MKATGIKKDLFAAAAFVLITALLTFNYMTNAFNNDDQAFGEFSADSESLVTSGIIAQQRELETEYPIGYYENAVSHEGGFLKGAELYNRWCAGITDNYFEFGYSRTVPGRIALGFNRMANRVYEQGKKVQLADGSVYNIEQVTVEGGYFHVQTDCEQLFSQQQNGVLLDAKFIDAYGNQIVTENYSPYISHYGLQGYIFNAVAEFVPMPVAFQVSNLMCAFLTAAVFSAMVIIIFKKYNATMAVCFCTVFLLSPIVTKFARDLYWVEFTWFAPVLVGLWCAAYFDNRTVRLCSCVMAFVTVFVKSLCGYEYISTILIAMMAFLFADFVAAICAGEKAKAGRYFKTMFIMGIMAVVGFLAAIFIHALIRGDGSVMTGVAEIWQKDVMRRTLGGNAGDFSEAYQASINASVTDVIKLYMVPEGEIIFHISGSWFKVLMLLPIAAFAVDFICCKKVDISEAVIYVLTFAAALSWFVLAKSHSYEHTHLNAVMWYFGFVQMCFYIPIHSIIKILKQLSAKKI